MKNRTLPSTATAADPAGGAKLFLPAAARNAGPIAELLAQVAPERGRALELASGSGQHVSEFAARLPGLSWQPSEPDPERRASIDAYAADLPNVAAAVEIDACTPGWAAEHGGQDLILLVNLLHLVSETEAGVLIAEAARALAPGGVFVVYGPFMRAGELTSEGDRAFHDSLVAGDPEIGYKDDFDTMDAMLAAGLEMARVVEMPANNLALVARKP